ncbi:MAG: hypothetical protein R2741_00270 [Methanolobus sp.]
MEVETSSLPENGNVSQKNDSHSCLCLLKDNTAWVDLILSKTALILATVIILAAVYSLAGSSSELVKKDELELITVDLVSNIDAAGGTGSDAGNIVIYSFDLNSEELVEYEKMNISVSGEYVRCALEDGSTNIVAARPLSYSTLPFSPEHLRTLLSGQFAADGSIGQPVNSSFPYNDVTDFLSLNSAEALNLNTSRDVFIEKRSVFVVDGSEVNELEYVLVYQ